MTHRHPTRPKMWIQAAHIKRGALRRQLRVPAGAVIPLAVLRCAAESPGALGRRARLAITLRKSRARTRRSRMRRMTRAEVRAAMARVKRYGRKFTP